MNNIEETKDQIIIDTIQSCGNCGDEFFLIEGLLCINQGFFEFTCNSCRRGENA